jgi:hypothetical protein
VLDEGGEGVVRIAGPLLIAFIATLIYSGWRITVRTKQRKEDIVALELLVSEICHIAYANRDIDPSAELIIMKIQEHDNHQFVKEIK